MSADPLEHKVPRHVPGEQYEKAYDLANRRGKQVIELRQKLDAAEAALAAFHQGKVQSFIAALASTRRAPTKREWGLLRLSLANYHTATTEPGEDEHG